MCLFKHYDMKRLGGFSETDTGGRLDSQADPSASGTHWLGNWVEPRSFLEPVVAGRHFIETDVNFGAFTVVKIQVEVSWVMTPCCAVAGYERFEGPCCLRLHGEVSTAWIGIQVVFWVVTPCNVVVGYQSF